MFRRVIIALLLGTMLLAAAGCTRTFVVTGAASKTWAMTGWRLGWVVGPVELATAIRNHPDDTRLVHALWQSLGRAQAPDVGLVGIEGARMRLQYTQGAEYAERVLQTDATVTALKSSDRAAREVRAVGQLRLRQSS